MPLELVTLRCLKDNYAYLLHSDAGTVLIDAPEAMPVLTELEARGWGLDWVGSLWASSSKEKRHGNETVAQG